MLDTGRVWVKLSGPMRCTKENYPYPEVTPLAHALVRHAPERLVWGTDWPHVNLDGREMPNDGDLLDLLAEWVPDGATRDRILVDNACALYGFSPAEKYRRTKLALTTATGCVSLPSLSLNKRPSRSAMFIREK